MATFCFVRSLEKNTEGKRDMFTTVRTSAPSTINALS